MHTCQDLHLPVVRFLKLSSGVAGGFSVLRAVKADVTLSVSFQGVYVSYWGQFGQSFLH